MTNRTSPATARTIRENLAASNISAKLEKLVQRAQAAGVLVVADSDSVALRIIPSSEVTEDADLHSLGILVKVHNACGGGTSSIGSHPATHAQ